MSQTLYFIDSKLPGAFSKPPEGKEAAGSLVKPVAFECAVGSAFSSNVILSANSSGTFIGIGIGMFINYFSYPFTDG